MRYVLYILVFLILYNINIIFYVLLQIITYYEKHMNNIYNNMYCTLILLL